MVFVLLLLLLALLVTLRRGEGLCVARVHVEARNAEGLKAEIAAVGAGEPAVEARRCLLGGDAASHF